LSGLYLGLLVPFAGATEAIAIAVFGGLFLFAISRAFVLIRAGRVASHREWMLRAFAIAIGISTVRVFGAIFDVALTPAGFRTDVSFALAIWAGWATTLGAAEIWIRFTRRRAAWALQFVALTLAFATASPLSVASQQPAPTLPSSPLRFGVFVARFGADGSFLLEGQGWPPFKGVWKSDADRIELTTSGGPPGCEGPGRYRFRIDRTRVSFDLVSDDCMFRRMIVDRSVWRPEGEAEPVPVRRIVRTAAASRPALPDAGTSNGSWPAFRGPQASGIAESQLLPDRWDGKTGENILWRTPIPGLAHSSPIVWGQRIFVTTAVSSRGNATFRPGLYGDGDASDDRSRHRWMIYALDKHSGKIIWERVAYEGEPVDKRHIKSTYASATPATDGRIIVASFGSQGVHAYDVNGNFLWKVDLSRLNLGAYDIPTFEWGPASSPIIWNGLVILQCDTQADSFLLALKAETGETVWKTDRQELPSWGTPTVAATPAGPELVTNAANFIRGYDPRTGKELWRLGGSSKITAPTPVFGDGLFVVASGRGPERPIFVMRPGAHGDLTLPEGKTASDAIVWSRTARGPYMPTPLIYNGLLYVLNNNGVLDAYQLRSGEEVYRQRLPQIGSGYSASPVAADGKIYLSNEDGEMLVVAAGKEFRHIATNSMGELLMATPALSDGAIYVRSSASLFAVGKKP
jgi:outer membrane protein assembly factor BamB